MLALPGRQYANPLIVRGMTANAAKGHAKQLFPFFPSADQGGFSEKWFQETPFENPSLLPASEIETAFHSLEAVALELPIGVNRADLLLVNPEGCIVLVETKLFKNPWYQELLFENLFLLPASEIEHEFHSLEARGDGIAHRCKLGRPAHGQP